MNMLGAFSSEGDKVISHINHDGGTNVMMDGFKTKRLSSRRSRCSSVNSVATAETCNSSINSSTRSLQITTGAKEIKCRKRRIHFESAQEEFSAIHCLPDDVGELWYLEKDYMHFRSIARKESSITYQLQPGVIHDLQAVYEVRGNLIQAPLVYSRQNDKESMTLGRAVHIIGSGLRGLEALLVKQMSVDRKAVLKGVLDMQTKLPSGLSANERAIAIAAKARFLSRQFRNFAQVQGRADAMVVDNTDGEE